MSAGWLGAAAGGSVLTVKATPRSARDEVLGVESEAWLRVRLRAPPVDGQANTALEELLAERLGVPRRAVRVAGGATARLKRVAVTGLVPGEVRRRLGV